MLVLFVQGSNSYFTFLISFQHCRPPMSENGKLLSRDRRMLPQLMARVANMTRADAHATRRRRDVNAYASGVETADGASDLAVDMNLDLQMQVCSVWNAWMM